MAKTTMSTVDKALSLLRYFSVQKPELGLSELAREAGYDKTTTLRCMTALERNGFVEQDAGSRKYRLGIAPIHYAQIREQSFPVRSVIKRYLDELARSLNETAHCTLLTGGDPLTASISEPDGALFVHVDPSSPLPWHATASGIAILAFMPVEVQAEILDCDSFNAYTEHTPTSREQLECLLRACQAEGLARMQSTFEDGVVGTAVPIFGEAGIPIGSVAVAAIALRLTPKLQACIDGELKLAANSIMKEMGGIRPAAAKNIKGTGNA